STTSRSSSALSDGTELPSKRTLRYGLSSTTSTPNAAAMSSSAVRRSTGITMPVERRTALLDMAAAFDGHRDAGRIVEVWHVVDELRRRQSVAPPLFEQRRERVHAQARGILRHLEERRAETSNDREGAEVRRCGRHH